MTVKTNWQQQGRPEFLDTQPQAHDSGGPAFMYLHRGKNGCGKPAFLLTEKPKAGDFVKREHIHRMNAAASRTTPFCDSCAHPITSPLMSCDVVDLRFACARGTDSPCAAHCGNWRQCPAST